ncbi:MULTISPECIES: hypothetical protein [Paenibacillus]|uniref:hypothetical protein n=1 Tax=Paenibacillus TaxID=44249 RepID=UPI00020D67FF|nr:MULTISPECIES: hypothetical protein [Paenibacillus]EGL19034.1 hypothetical protein HMPREF9413_1010 [Paenibacillus sp. HGF7]EPD81042.1 hypothetical protein HMPREF1207_04799 [Paenibacillus sp. HGH0039]MBV6714930.1 hypothetical protein [Paenibacillus chitinolyticus]
MTFPGTRLLAMMNRYVACVGSYPYRTPATLTMIAYLLLLKEMCSVQGGSCKPIEAPERQARKKGVDSKMSIPVAHFYTLRETVGSARLVREHGSETDIPYGRPGRIERFHVRSPIQAGVPRTETGLLPAIHRGPPDSRPLLCGRNHTSRRRDTDGRAQRYAGGRSRSRCYPVRDVYTRSDESS